MYVNILVYLRESDANDALDSAHDWAVNHLVADGEIDFVRMADGSLLNPTGRLARGMLEKCEDLENDNWWLFGATESDLAGASDADGWLVHFPAHTKPGDGYFPRD